MNDELVAGLMEQQYELAHGAWKRGQMFDFMAGYHIGAITAFSLVLSTQSAFDRSLELVNKIHEMKINQAAFQADPTAWGTA